MVKPKLRIGLLLDGYDLPNWTVQMIDQIQQSKNSEIVLTILKKKRDSVKNPRYKTILGKDLLYNLYCKFENLLYDKGSNLFKVKDIRGVLNCPELDISFDETSSEEFGDLGHVKTIQDFNLDVLIKLVDEDLKGDFLKLAKQGIWYYHHGDYKTNRGDSPGVWEVLKNYDTIGTTLLKLTDNPEQDIIIGESYSSADRWSILRGKNNYYEKAITLLPKKLEQLYCMGENEFMALLEQNDSAPYFYSNPLNGIPSNYEMLGGVISNYRKKLWKKIESIFYLEQWIVLFYYNEKNEIPRSFHRFEKMLPPKNSIWADPFVLFREHKYYIFIEEMTFAENKGKISVIEIDRNGNYGKPQIIIEEDFHLSYPFLIEENGELYMIPETGMNHTIQIYHCTKFPFQWELKKVLINNIRAKDATIFKHKNQYWLFASVNEQPNGPIHDDLFLFYSDNLLEGDWTPHPQNPIVSDVSSARPAGNIFTHNGRIYRPSQNGSKHYGYGMQIKEITTLNKNRYEEKEVQSIKPNWAKEVIGTHTLNFDSGFTVIDALIKRPKYFI
jgi:hypothetical protein